MLRLLIAIALSALEVFIYARAGLLLINWGYYTFGALSLVAALFMANYGYEMISNSKHMLALKHSNKRRR